MVPINRAGDKCWNCKGGLGADIFLRGRYIGPRGFRYEAVCEDCGFDKEPKATKTVECVGCGRRLLMSEFFDTDVCSDRCYNRKLRARRRAMARATCLRCSSSFTPKRKDACYCSGACKQAAYRERSDGHIAALIEEAA